MNKFPLDGEYSYIAGVEETKSSAEDTCPTEECVTENGVNFVRTAFDGNLIKGGVYLADAISHTGNAEAEMNSKICYVTRKSTFFSKTNAANFLTEVLTPYNSFNLREITYKNIKKSGQCMSPASK